MAYRNVQTGTIVVVDSKPGDYADLLQSAHAGDWCFTFLGSGRSALRFTSVEKTSLWLINVCLPDFSARELYPMLRPQLNGIPACLVGDQYRLEDELMTYSVRATAYVCKPVDDLWLWRWCFSDAPHARPPPPAA